MNASTRAEACVMGAEKRGLSLRRTRRELGDRKEAQEGSGRMAQRQVLYGGKRACHFTPVPVMAVGGINAAWRMVLKS